MDAINLSGVWLNFPLVVAPPVPPVVVSGSGGAGRYTTTRVLQSPSQQQEFDQKLNAKRWREYVEQDDLMLLLLL